MVTLHGFFASWIGYPCHKTWYHRGTYTSYHSIGTESIYFVWQLFVIVYPAFQKLMPDRIRFFSFHQHISLPLPFMIWNPFMYYLSFLCSSLPFLCTLLYLLFLTFLSPLIFYSLVFQSFFSIFTVHCFYHKIMTRSTPQTFMTVSKTPN